MRRKPGESDAAQHQFGGRWTETKLKILQRYLEGYTTALKEQPFVTAYIDAFAGTGYRTSNQLSGGLPLFPDLAGEAPQELLDGSARLALKVKPRFHKYVFIEKDPGRCAQLEKLKEEFADRAKDISIRPGDANEEIKTICRKNWKERRAVLFLDPYGMQVEWQTIEAIARTGAIDLWILFPVGVGVNRVLPRSGEIPAGWRIALNRLLGSEDWYSAFYEVSQSKTLFNEEETTVVKRGIETIGDYFKKRLESVFPGVAPKPKILTNSTNSPLYLFCFAVGSPNPKARQIALRIANHILDRI